MNGTARLMRFIVLAAGVAAPCGDLVGQNITGRALIATAWSSVRVGDVTERVGGFWPGGALDIQMGPVTITGSGTRGQFTSGIPFQPLERDAGELSVSGRFEPRTWLRFEARYAARVFSSPPGRQRWDIVGFGAAASPALGTPALRAFVGLAYLPHVRVSGTAASHTGVAGDVGIEVVAPRAPVVLALRYRIERFDFPRAMDRSEQFEAFTVSLGIRLRRLDGHWTLVH